MEFAKVANRPEWMLGLTMEFTGPGMPQRNYLAEVCFAVIWGASVIPDSAQFSALVADAAPPDQVGSLMTFQTALGFALTFVTVQAAPIIADAIGWPMVLASLALGPLFGIAAIQRLRALNRARSQ